MPRVPPQARRHRPTHRVVPLTELRLRAARARIAELTAPAPQSGDLGSIQLRPDQCELVARVLAHLECHGGCLVADEVGRGKTYVALAVARAWQKPLIVIPASLRSMWTEAMTRAGCAHPVVTHEALSVGQRPTHDFDGIVVDESHRFRNAGTRRHAMLAELASRCPVLLLSATPVQNGAGDLAAQLALFVGSGAFRLDERLLARHVVRGGDLATPSLPALAPSLWVRPRLDDGHVLQAILSLPPPPRPAGGGDAGTLRTIGLVRAWASSRGALRAMLARRRRIAAAIEQCVESGRLPTARELRAWEGCDDGAVQLGFVPLLVERMAEQDQLRLLARQIDAERRAHRALEDLMRETADPDLARCETLRAIRRAHPRERILAFAELAATVRTYHSTLRCDAAVGMLTANEARIASGRIARDELLARFAPTAQGAPAAAAREHVSLLLTTDLLSEGVNLQDASVVVHLDLPWNPARLAQRVGRVRRVGGADLVHSYLVAPPASSELLLRVEERLRRKLAHASGIIGGTMPLIPILTESGSRAVGTEGVCGAESAAARARTMDLIATWRCARARSTTRARSPLVAGVEAGRSGWLAALSDRRLVASLDGAPPNDGATVARVVTLANGRARAVGRDESTAALAGIERWIRSQRAAIECGAADVATPLQHAVERHLAECLQRAPRHARGALIPVLARLREALRRPPSLGAERALAALLLQPAESPVDVMRWLRTATDLLSGTTVPAAEQSDAAHVMALILVGPDTFAGTSESGGETGDL